MTNTKDKPIVHYRGVAERVGDSALLFPVDHPSDYVSNATIALTSRVVSWEGDRIETANTVYLPEEIPC